MWQPNWIKSYNLASFNNVEHTFSPECFIVQGENRTDDGQESNGSGKTAFNNLLPILLLGQSLEGTSLKDLVNWNSEEKHFAVEGELSNQFTKQRLWIKRIAYNNTKSAELYIKVNGEVPESLVSKSNVEEAVDSRDGNTFIIDMIGISKEDLLSYYFISGNYYTPFLKASNKSKIETISRFSKTDKVDKAIEEIKEEKEDDKEELNFKQREIDKINTQIETNNDNLEYFKNEDFEQRRQDEINKIQESIKQLNNNISENEKLIEARKEERQEFEQSKQTLEENKAEWETYKTSLETKLNKLQDQINEEKYSDNIQEYRDKIEELEQKIKENKNQVQEVKEVKQELQTIVKGTVVCPNCSHEFNPNDKEADIEQSKADIEECKGILDDLEQNYINKDRKETERINNEIEKLKQQEKEEKKELQGEKKNLQSKIKEVENDIHSLQKQIKDCEVNIDWKDKQIEKTHNQIKESKESIKKYERQIEEIKNKEYEDRSEELRKKISELEGQLETKQCEYAEVEAKLADKEKWITRFEDFKFYLANKPIQAICNNINYYLKKAGSDLSVEIEGFKRLKSGKIKQELNPQIYRNGLDPHPLGNFSGGERARINLCCDLAFTRILNESSETGGFNHYQNDELLNPVDSQGIQNIAKAFSELNKSIMLVTHSAADLTFENIIKIVKENGISYIENN